MYISQDIIEKWLKEDMPYFDLTTQLLLEEDHLMQMEFHVREKAVLSGSEEVARLANMVGAKVTSALPSGSVIEPGNPFCTVQGTFSVVNQIGKVAQNIFEYGSGVATRTAHMTNAVKAIDPALQILPTRKIYPGTKELAVKSILAGGAYPHRLGVSETILLFKQHIEYIGGWAGLPVAIDKIRKKDVEKKIIVEVETEEEAQLVSTYEVDGIQYDKFSPEILRLLVADIKSKNPKMIHLAAGGIHQDNVIEYAKTGVDGLVTTSVYFGRPVNIGITYKRLL